MDAPVADAFACCRMTKLMKTRVLLVSIDTAAFREWICHCLNPLKQAASRPDEKPARSFHNGYGRIFSSYKSSGSGRSTEFLPTCPNSSSDENLATRRSMSRCGWHGFSQKTKAAQSGGRLSSGEWKGVLDGAHDEESQFLGVRMAEDLLADNAVVIVDDWRHAKDSESYAEAGTKRAISDSPNEWSIRHVLPARYNGDLELWWNGVGVLRFKRVQPMPDQMM